MQNNLRDSVNSISSEGSNNINNHRNSVLARDPELLSRFRTDIEVKFSELRTRNATLETNFNTMQTEKNLRIQNLEDELSLLRIQHDNISKDHSYTLLQNKEIFNRITKVTEERDLLLIKISQLQSQVSNSNLNENNRIKSNEKLTEEIYQIRKDFNELLQDRDYWRDSYNRYKFETDKQISVLKENFDVSMKERDALHEQVLRVVKERNDLLVQLENLNRVNKKNEEDIRLYITRIQNLEKENQDLKAENKDKSNQIENFLLDREKLNNQINQYNSQVKYLENSGNTYLLNLEKTKKERDDLTISLANLGQELNLQKNESLKQQEKIKLLEFEINNLNERLKVSNIEKQTLNTNLANKFNELKLKNEVITDLESRIKNLELEKDKNLELIESLRKDNSNLNVSLGNLQKENDELKNRLNLNVVENNKLRGEISLLELKVKNLENENKRLNEELNLTIRNLKDTVKEFEKYKVDNLLKLDAYYNLQKRFDEVRRLHNNDIEKLKALQLNFKNLQLQKNNIEKDLENLNQVVCSSNDSNDELQRSLEMLEKKMDELTLKNKDYEKRLNLYMGKDAENTSKIYILETKQNENSKLIADYENLLKDLKIQINNNENLNLYVRELQAKLDLQNQKIADNDNEIKKMIGLLQDKNNKFEGRFTDRIERSFLEQNEKEISSLKKRINEIELRGFNRNITVTKVINGN
jgi:chromosome segregation ATPase